MQTKRDNSRALAVIFSLIMPGGGHIYLGYFVRGLLFLILFMLLNLAIMYLWTIYISAPLVIGSMLSVILFYLYIVYDAFRLSKFNKKVDKFYNEWIIVLLIWIPAIYFLANFLKEYSPIRTFVLPSSSMENTLHKGDFLVATKSSDIKRGDIVIFKMPKSGSFYIKRAVASSGDEVIYIDKKLLIHFSEGDNFITQNYPQSKIITLDGKLWVVNPYIKNTNIKYTPNYSINSFLIMVNMAQNGKVTMEAKNFKDLNNTTFKIGDKSYNAFYKKVQNGYFMMGDNRDNSNDSRFFGEIGKNLIYGKPKAIYFNLKKGKIDTKRIKKLWYFRYKFL